MWVDCLPFGVSTWCRWSGILAILLTLAKMYRNPSFCPLSRFVLGASLANMALFRVFRAFLESFGVFVCVCLVWGFLWLVGLLCACGVRRI